MVEQTMLAIGIGVSCNRRIVGSFGDQKRSIKKSHRRIEDFTFLIDIDT
ncbi:MAG: hypothetical protein J6Q70_04605 [Clostridia bacterium]|nr:hypothetical protein [Clostridia bacterium]